MGIWRPIMTKFFNGRERQNLDKKFGQKKRRERMQRSRLGVVLPVIVFGQQESDVAIALATGITVVVGMGFPGHAAPIVELLGIAGFEFGLRVDFRLAQQDPVLPLGVTALSHFTAIFSAVQSPAELAVAECAVDEYPEVALGEHPLGFQERHERFFLAGAGPELARDFRPVVRVGVLPGGALGATVVAFGQLEQNLFALTRQSFAPIRGFADVDHLRLPGGIRFVGPDLPIPEVGEQPIRRKVRTIDKEKVPPGVESSNLRPHHTILLRPPNRGNRGLIDLRLLVDPSL